MAAMAVSYFLLRFCRTVILLWLPYYNATVLGMDETAAGVSATSFEVGGFLSVLASGRSRGTAGQRDKGAAGRRGGKRKQKAKNRFQSKAFVRHRSGRKKEGKSERK